MKTLLKTLQTHRRTIVASPFHTHKLTPLKQSPPTNKGILIWLLPTHHGEGWSYLPSTSTWDFLDVCKIKKPRDKCLLPTWPIHLGTNYPGSLRVSGINLPIWGNGGDGGSGLAKAMLVVWPCKVLVWKTQALAWLTLDKALPGQQNRNGKLVSVWTWKRWRGHRSHVGLGGTFGR